MQRRMRPITYAESLQAKEFAEENNQQIAEPDEIKEPKKPLNHLVTSNNSVKVNELPSGGSIYPKEAEIYITPFSFGEMKYLSGSILSDPENIEFFLNKIQTSFPKENLTYYDFYFLTVLIKMSTFGEIEYTMTFECQTCGHVNKVPFKSSDLEFYDIKVPFPVTIDLKSPYISTETGQELLKVSFVPVSIGRYKTMLEQGTAEDYDVYIANCIVEGTEEERLDLVKNYLNGADVNLLETIDTVLFHGVKDIKMKCKNKILPEGAEASEGNEEVCGREYDLPFLDIPEHISTTDECQESLGQRIHFGV